MKIAHISPDEKFIESIQWQFEKIFPGQNSFFVFLVKQIGSTKYVHAGKSVQLLADDAKGLKKILEEIKKYDLVIFHGLKYFQSQIVLKAATSDNFVWFFWGGEIYDNYKAVGHKVLGKKTKEKFVGINALKMLKRMVRPAYYLLRFKSMTPEASVLKAAKKIPYIGIIHEEEIEYLKQNDFIGQSAKHVPMTYYPLEFIFKGIEDITITGKNILLGNSASLTNNHLEAFEKIRLLNLEDRELIVPLSYGDQKYATEICKTGKNLFGKSFSPIVDFMPLHEYNFKLSSCSIVIMNHYRQQAVGNILAMLWMGAKIYLNEGNTFYQYLKKQGILVYSIDKDFVIETPEVLTGLTSMQIESNRKRLLNLISFETTKERLREELRNIVHGD
ncbi:MAG: TDP-N-acetylfucosamine:lipid II N-acetylfucosaminyltransferase [Allomuricauda sp.]